MNPSQIRFAQSVSGRQQQILTHGTVVPQPGASSTVIFFEVYFVIF